MTTTERNAATARRNEATLTLFAPLALPIADALCVIIALAVRLAARIRDSLIADRAARRNLNAARTHAMTRSGPCNLTAAPALATVPIATLVPTAPAASDVVNAADLEVTQAACRMVGRSEWAPMTTGLSLFSVKVEAPAIDPAPAAAQPTSERDSIKVDYVSQGEARLTDKGVEVEVAGMTYRDCQVMCKAFNLKANGKGEALRAALVAHLIALKAKGQAK